MNTTGNKTPATDQIDEKIESLKNLPIIKDYYLFLEGGKISTDFLQSARKNAKIELSL